MSRPKILIVDDQQTNIALLKSLLSDYDTLEATSGRLALKLISDHKPDLILLDIMMPGIDGYSVLSIVKNSAHTRGIPVIVISALGGMDEKLKSLDKGADGFIIKPVNPHELKATIKALLRVKVLYDELDAVQKTLISVASMLDDKHLFRSGHSHRTAHYAVRLARLELLQPWQLEEIRLAALVHDIGYATVPESILLKGHSLTPEEFAYIRNHPLTGETICSALASFKSVLPYIRHHHENYDGTGYPDRLKGAAIPHGARILAIADAYDALTNDRPYRSALTQGEALEILKNGAGIRWDPALVALFCRLITEYNETAPESEAETT